MMKKISKLLAVVLAVAMLICPAMCLTSMAETSTDAYTLNYADGVLTVNVAPGEDFLVSLLKIDIEGYVVDEDNIAVTTEEGVSFSANPSYENGVLTLLLASKEAANVHLVSSATVTIPATKDESASKYYIALTNIQVATAGTADAPDSFIAIDGVDADGAVENVVNIVGGATACTHENIGAWEITQPTKTNTGLKTRTCECGYTEEEVIPAAQLDTTMVFRTPLVTIGETLGLRFRAKASVLNDATATYKFVVTPQKYDGTTLAEYTGATVEYPVVKSGSNYQVDISNIAITELGLNVKAYIARYNAEGIFEAYSEVDTANPAAILKGMITESAASGTTAYKLNTMIVDLLNLGAEAQNYFPGLLGSTTCDLYKAPRVNQGVNQKFASDSVSLNAVNNTTWNSGSSVTSTTNALAMSVGINPAPAPVYTIRNATATGNNPLDYSKLTFTVSYTSQYDGKTRTTTITGDDWNALVSKKHLKYTFDKVAMYDADQVITAVLSYNGTEVFTSTYTVENFINEYKSDASMGTIVTNVGRFGVSARAYFLSLS